MKNLILLLVTFTITNLTAQTKISKVTSKSNIKKIKRKICYG